MTHRIALNFEDGVTRFVEARPGELVADAAYRGGVNIPMDCRDGACGTCKCQCESGAYTLGSYIDDAMTEDEAKEGFVLTCQMKATSDCVIRIPASSTVCKVKAGSIPA
jgi:benzoate/toluate 1,2-dioxygenase reductase component